LDKIKPPFLRFYWQSILNTVKNPRRFLTEAKKSGVKRSLLDKSKQVKARTYLLGANAYAFKDRDSSTVLRLLRMTNHSCR